MEAIFIHGLMSFEVSSKKFRTVVTYFLVHVSVGLKPKY